MLLPFFSWSLISTMLFELASSFIHLESILQSSGVNPFINIALGYCDFNSPLWFLPCFLLRKLYYGSCKNIHQAHIGNKFLIYCVIGSFALCLMWPYMNETEIFWNVYTAVILLPFVVLGRISSIWLNDCNVLIKTIGVATFLLGAGMAGVYLNTQIGYLGCCYGNCLVFYVAVICSIFEICILSKKIFFGKNMKFLGRNAMSVLAMHKFLIIILLLLPSVKKYD